MHTPGKAEKPGSIKPVWIMAGVAVLLVMLGVTVALGLFARYLLTPRAVPVEGLQSVVGQDSTGVIHLRDPANDPGIADLFDTLLTAGRKAQVMKVSGEASPVLTWLATLGRIHPGGKMTLLEWPESIVVYEPVPQSDPPDYGVVVSLAGLPLLTKTALGLLYQQSASDPDVEAYTFRGHTLHASGPDSVTAFTGEWYLLARSREVMSQLVNRLEDSDDARHYIQLLPAEFSERWDLGMAVDNRSGALGPVFLMLGLPFRPDAPDLGSVDQFRVGLDCVTADEWKAEIRIRCGSRRKTASWAEHARAVCKDRELELAPEGLNLSSRVDAKGREVIVSLQLSGMKAWLEKKVREAVLEAKEEKSSGAGGS